VWDRGSWHRATPPFTPPFTPASYVGKRVGRGIRVQGYPKIPRGQYSQPHSYCHSHHCQHRLLYRDSHSHSHRHSHHPPGCGRWYAPSPRHLRSLSSAGGLLFVWSFVVLFLSCRVLCCSCCVFVSVTCFSSNTTVHTSVGLTSILHRLTVRGEYGARTTDQRCAPQLLINRHK